MKPKTVVAIAISACILIAGYKLAKTLYNRLPVAEVNECLYINYKGLDAIVRVIQNNDNSGVSVIYSYKTLRILEAGYGDLRTMNARLVECPK